MHHDPASAALVVRPRGLKMYGMAQAVGDLVEQGAPAFEAAIPTLSQLLKAELAERVLLQTALQGEDLLERLPVQAIVPNRPATKGTWARMSRPPTSRTCPFLTIAMAS